MNWDKQEAEQEKLASYMMLLQDKVQLLISEISKTEKITQLNLGDRKLIYVGIEYSINAHDNPEKIKLCQTLGKLLRVQKEYTEKYLKGECSQK
jgi:hypothetical protein